MCAIRPNLIHVILLDGTFASLEDGRRSSIGRIHALLRGHLGPVEGRIRLHYESGQQWDSWRTLPELIMGQGVPSRIINAYSWLASGYRPGDQIYMFGYSRGAFIIRSLAGMIGQIGLLRADAATERNIRLAWRYYSEGGSDDAIATFRHRRGLQSVPIRMIGCFDTVMALGVRLPLLWMLTEPRFRFHDTRLGPEIENGFHALALDETRAVFAPILWDNSSHGHIEQAWFRGAHADIGGQLSGLEIARPLANIPLVWMLERAGSVGLPLPHDWRVHFACDVTAPSLGSWRNWGKAFLSRAARIAGQNPTEILHRSVPRPYEGPAHLVGQLAQYAEPQPRRWFRSKVQHDPGDTAKTGGL